MGLAGGGQFAQQSGAGAMRVLAFEPFDESGGVGRDGVSTETWRRVACGMS
jgi:hypothetical protein